MSTDDVKKEEGKEGVVETTKTDAVVEATAEATTTANEFEEYEMASIFSDDLTESMAEETVTVGGGDPNIYSLSLKNENVVNGIYKSVGRFIKNPRVPKWNGVGEKPKPMNILHKWQYFLPNPENPESSFVVDCTSNFGQRDNIVSKAFFHLKNTNNPSLMALGKKHFSRKGYFYTPLQIVKDVQQPDLEGKIKIVRFAKQINEKIEDIIKSDEATNQVGVNYSHPLTGRNFIFQLQEEEFVDQNNPNKKTKLSSYSKSKFEEKETMLLVPDCAIPAGNTPEYQKAIFDYMLAECPKLEDYKAVAWDEATEKKIIEAVRMVIEDDNIFGQIYRKMYGRSYIFDGNTLSQKEKGGGLQIEEASMLEKTTEEEVTEEIHVNSPTAQTGYAKEDDLPDDLEA